MGSTRTAAPRRGSPRGRRAAAAANTRQRLVAAAGAALVAREGELEMTDVATRAGASIGLAYHHFGSKAGLLAAIVSDFYDRYDAVVNAPMDPNESWASRERRRLDEVIAFLFSDPLASVVLGQLGRTPEVAAVEGARQRGVIALAARNVANGQRHGAIAGDVDPEIAGAAIIGGVRQACMLALALPRRPSRQRLADQLWSFIAGAVRLQEETTA